ncbi:MAG: flavodoxin-dependent (E)-4-hydroxy-3-methylbut-2-enyl-diphosphate synthase [Bacillota bacterium]|uniref:flavodoxin-dependent (E)-4-hydroxy-3-methylbut-2-enyl-diphosphate synthase n=1 Tax=Desulforudis sp. DRI-14 TaxID=3459793 RepID=UPI00348A0A8C
MNFSRRKTRPVYIGNVQVGGDAPVSVQSMTNTDTRDVEATVAQIRELAGVGCEIVRLAVPDREAAEALAAIRKRVSVPLVADIHFDYRLALAAIKAGVDGLRINPGNIGGRAKVKAVVEAARDRGIPIRIGVNAGSLDKRLLEKHGLTPEAMVASALEHIRILEDLDHTAIKVSLKASDVLLMVEAYRRLARQVDYPFHVGVTEAGTMRGGLVKSAVGIGILLAEGIGDTIRVSLTASPRHEVWAGYEILKTLGLRRRGVELVSCPTCGRTQIDVIRIAAEVEDRLQAVTKPIKVAVMGCVVNGPGEAREADVGIAGGKGVGLLFRKGEIIGTVPEDRMIEALMAEIEKLEDKESKSL